MPIAKRLARRPGISSLGVSLIVFVAVSGLGILLGMFVMLADNGPCEPPCHGGAMAAAGIWAISFWAGIAFSVLFGIASYVMFRSQSE